jgi:hypothetical protein
MKCARTVVLTVPSPSGSHAGAREGFAQRDRMPSTLMNFSRCASSGYEADGSPRFWLTRRRRTVDRCIVHPDVDAELHSRWVAAGRPPCSHPYWLIERVPLSPTTPPDRVCTTCGAIGERPTALVDARDAAGRRSNGART